MLKILLVEDDKTIVTNLTEYLNGAGYIVRSVSGQAAAMAALAEEKADLGLLDGALAGGKGGLSPLPICSDTRKQMATPSPLRPLKRAGGRHP